MTRLVAVMVFLLTAFAHVEPATGQATRSSATRPSRPLRILFIGNEYTSANGGLHSVLQAMAKSRGHALECVASTASGKTLQWHWESGPARTLIARKGWDYVVLQVDSGEATAQALKLLDIVRSFDAEVRKAGAGTILLSPASEFAQSRAEQALAQGVERFAEKSDTRVAPVGTAARTAIVDKPGLKLRAAGDGRLPPAGTYLAACVLHVMLFDESAENLPASVTTTSGTKLTIPPDDAKVIQRAADVEATPWLPPATGPAYGEAEDNVVFVVDATGTMLGLRYKLAQEYVRQAVARLTPQQRFNVVFFRGGDTEDEWRAPLALGLLQADVENVRKAHAFIDDMTVIGKGTNPLPSLRLAFGLRPDVIYWLSDGEFNNVVSYEQVIAEVRKLNARRRTRLNTIGISCDDPQAKATLETLAHEHGGTFVKLTDKGVESTSRPAVP
jgi:hypothetical protein